MSKASLLKRMKNALSQIQEYAKEEPNGIDAYRPTVSNYDWGFAPVISDGKVNVGFKKAFLPPNEIEAYGADFVGPIDGRKFYKIQNIDGNGNITRRVVTDNAGNTAMTYSIVPVKYSNSSGVKGTIDYSKNADAKSLQQSVPGKWMKTPSGKWMVSKSEGVEIPLSDAKKLKNTYRNAFIDVDMRGKRNDTRLAELDEQNDMKRIARYEGTMSSNSDRYDPNAGWNASGRHGNTQAMTDAINKVRNNKSAAIDAQISSQFDQNTIRRKAIEEQIAKLQEQLKSVKNEGEAELDTYYKMRDEIRRLPDWYMKNK